MSSATAAKDSSGNRPGVAGGGFSRWSAWLLALALALFVALTFEVGARLRFPWDAYIWSESPFLTNMLKLNAGRSIYGPPSDANSFVYGPALEYLCYALLHPFGCDLDIRYCRAVVVAAGLTGCIVSGRAGGQLLSELGVEDRDARAFVPFGTMLAVLVLAKNFTSDVCHPDNLMVAHAFLSFWLCWGAVAKGGMRRALVAIVVGSVGVLVKQTGAGTGIAALIGLFLLRSEYRSVPNALALASGTAVASGGAVASLLVPQNARFWTFHVLRAQAIDWEKLDLFHWAILPFPHRVVLYALAPVAWAWLLLRPEVAARRFAMLWLVFASVACGPAVSALLKSFGSWNNLGIFDVWAVLVVAPALWHTVATRLTGNSRTESAAERALCATALGLLLTLLFTAIPTRAWPTKAHYAAARELDAELARARKKGERVLVAHGTAALVHAGYRDVPLDRANSILELWAGQAIDRALTSQRLRQRAYDHVYLNVGEWYGPLLSVIQEKYEESGIIRSPSARSLGRGTEALSDRFGYQATPKLMDAEVHIYRRK